MTKHAPRDHLVRDQFSGIAVSTINDARLQAEAIQQAIQAKAFEQAQEQIESVRRFLGSPENILGNPGTKHGEIAEQVEVAIRNARAALNQEEMTATFDGVGRTAPADYSIDGIEVQSKFYNGARNSLDGILNHLEKYPKFASADGYYHIPKDQYEVIQRLLSGEDVEEFSEKTVRAILAKIEEIESRVGRPFLNIVNPSSSRYAEVQQGAVHETLDSYDEEFFETNNRRKEEITLEHQPSLAEGLKATGIAAGLAGGLSLGAALYQKYREGKNPFSGEFTKEDWAEVGVKTAKGAAGGAVAGASLYVLINYAGMGAPLAAAVVSTGKGVASLSLQLERGEITNDQFVELGTILCAEAAIVALATVAGQTAIPIPVLGSIIGSLSGRFLAEVVTNTSADVARRLEADMEEFRDRLDDAQREIFGEIHAAYGALGGLMEAAFRVEVNCSLRERSLMLAQALGVAQDQLIHNDAELDVFMLS